MSETDKISVAELLRNPGGCVSHARDAVKLWRTAVFLLAVSLLGGGAFGFALGSFAGWSAALMDALKMMFVMLFPILLCYPTLYVFACLSGCTLSPIRILTVGLVATAVMGCLLAALAPVMWLFAVSTESLGFIVFFSCALAAVAAHFAHRPLLHVRELGIVRSLAGLRVWFAMFLLVALQTITLIRPMLPSPDDDRQPDGKCFFLEHFRRTLFEISGVCRAQ